MASDKSAPPHTPPPLPQGWVQKWDEQQRRAYFVDQNSGIAQWEYPTGSSKSSPESLPEKLIAELNHAKHNTNYRDEDSRMISDAEIDEVDRII